MTQLPFKAVYALTLSDIEMYPVWEYAPEELLGEGQDESWVIPRTDCTIPSDGDVTTVAAKFVGADGSKFIGLLQLYGGHTPWITGFGEVDESGTSWCEIENDEIVPSAFSTSTELTLKVADTAFPLSFETLGMLDSIGSALTGSIARANKSR
jgi:hypothetical protein